MATISHFVSNVWVVLMSQINSEAMFCLMFKSDLLFALHLKIAPELQISMEIQDGTTSHFVFNVLVVLKSEINSEAMFCLQLTFYLHFCDK